MRPDYLVSTPLINKIRTHKEKHTSVSEEVRRKAILRQERRKSIDISLLVTVRVALSVRGACRDAPSIVVGHIGDQTTDRCWRSGCLVQRAEKFRCGLNVGSPSQPASVTGIQVHDDVLQVQCLDSVSCESLVGGCSICAFLNIEVCHKVGKTVGF